MNKFNQLFNITSLVLILRLIHRSECKENSNKPAGLSMDLIIFSDDYANKTNSRCLDGSASGFYFKSGANSSNWVIFLGGGSYCDTELSCKLSQTNSKGSSNYWAPWLPESSILSSYSQINPDFYSWMKVYIPSCSEDFFSGQNKEPNEWGVYFSGHHIIIAVINMLLDNYQLIDAEKILISGVSTGGVGAIEHADFLSNWLKFSEIKVSPVGGWFYPQLLLNFTEWRLQLTSIYPSPHLNKLYNSYTHLTCTDANYLQPWLCGPSNVGYLYQYIRTELFVAENMFDSNQIYNYLGCPRNTTQSSDYIKYFGQLMVYSMQQIERSSKYDGIFMPACINHTADLLAFYSSPLIDGISYCQALGNWFFKRSTYNQLIDNCFTPNCNSDCLIFITK